MEVAGCWCSGGRHRWAGRRVLPPGLTAAAGADYRTAPSCPEVCTAAAAAVAARALPLIMRALLSLLLPLRVWVWVARGRWPSAAATLSRWVWVAQGRWLGTVVAAGIAAGAAGAAVAIRALTQGAAGQSCCWAAKKSSAPCRLYARFCAQTYRCLKCPTVRRAAAASAAACAACASAAATAAAAAAARASAAAARASAAATRSSASWRARATVVLATWRAMWCGGGAVREASECATSSAQATMASQVSGGSSAGGRGIKRGSARATISHRISVSSGGSAAGAPSSHASSMCTSGAGMPSSIKAFITVCGGRSGSGNAAPCGGARSGAGSKPGGHSGPLSLSDPRSAMVEVYARRGEQEGGQEGRKRTEKRVKREGCCSSRQGWATLCTLCPQCRQYAAHSKCRLSTAQGWYSQPRRASPSARTPRPARSFYSEALTLWILGLQSSTS